MQMTSYFYNSAKFVHLLLHTTVKIPLKSLYLHHNPDTVLAINTCVLCFQDLAAVYSLLIIPHSQATKKTTRRKIF